MATITTFSFETLRKILGHIEPERDFIVQQFDIKNAPYLEPCRIEAYFIAFLQKGELLVESDLVSYQLKAPAVFVMAPSVLRRFVHASGNFKSQVVLWEIAAANTAAKPSISFSHKQVIVSAFKSNLEAHFKTTRKVSFYASIQNLTSKYFSESIRQQTGKTAGELIDERVILEA